MARIHEIIVEVSKERGGTVATQKKDSGIKFAYRGVEEVVTHVASALNDAGVIYWPENVQKEIGVREIAGGKAITTTSVVVDYVFHAAEDDSEIRVQVPGLAQDFSDRSDAQSMSVALRTALIQLFKLQAGDKDPEQTGEETNTQAEKVLAAEKKAPAATKDRTARTAQAQLQAIIASQEPRHATYGGEEINALGDKHSGGADRQKWFSDLAVLDKILESVKNGEVA